MRVEFSGFLGANKALHSLVLPQGVGVDSINQKPGRGDLRPWKQPLLVKTLAGATAYASGIYRMGRDTESDTQYWLSWETDTDVARSLVADDPNERVFFTRDSDVPQWTARNLLSPTEPLPGFSLPLGVGSPEGAPTLVSQVGGTAATNTRYYVFTWVNTSGEEGPPSAPSAAVTGPSDATYTISRIGAPPISTAEWRLYRTQPGASVTSGFYFIGSAPAIGGGASTTIADANLPPQELLPSTNWIAPPSGLRGMKALWNGMLAGFIGKSIRFCDPYHPHAWPLDYELVVDDTIVALAVYEQNLIVLTKGRPYLITGSEPGAMSMQPVALEQSCVSKKSVVEFGHGVAWASPDGLVYMGRAGTRVVTSGLMLRDDWLGLRPSSIVAGQFDGGYLASYSANGLAYPNEVRAGFYLDPADPKGIYFIGAEASFAATFRDPINDALYVSSSTAQRIYKWDAGAANMTATFRSRTELLPKPTTFSFGRVIADAYPVTLKVYAGGVLRHTKTVQSDAPFRLPAGFTADQWQVQIETTSPVQAVLLANSATELQGGL